ncbi:endonuclease MutS2 [Prochlorococcus marinus]|uniref:Endonuclease MutS2 n=1 Tax=Prochlorococcus marinus (strain MIT 9211) TaxID=93059 RepID=A9BDI3_PROM4|nr:endonuclease MutS2 [Prochlorococcus marinus]ABX08169.1 putative DNA mismatch repair protein MutS family [Prochlorococcus marinus str. MIT 9211]
MDDLLNNSVLRSSATAFEETLELLDWRILCNHLSTFAPTAKGKRECKNIEIPQDIETTRKRLSETLEIGTLDKNLEAGISFQGVNELDGVILHCSKGGIASGEELLSIAETLRAVRRLKKIFEDPVSRPYTTSLFIDLATHHELEKVLLFGIEEGGRVADRASNQLSQLRRHLQDLRIGRRSILQDLIRRNGSILQDTVIAERYGRPVIAMKVGSVDQVPGVVHDSSSSGNTIFLEPQIVISLGNQIVEIQTKISKEEERLLSIWSQLVAKNINSLNHLSSVLLQLELGLARARYGDWLGGVLPVITTKEDDPFLIKDFSHPLLLWKNKKLGGHKVIPITFDVSKGLKVVAITGPNTGGKTIALKSFGLAVLMARCGMLLPCSSEPTLPWCNQVLADIGDEQSLEQNLSTFSGHIARIVRILDVIAQSPGPTVVLLDEVGAGTDPTEGSAIAISLLRALADSARLTIATTHLGELKALKYSDSRFENASVAFDSETIRPTYHLLWGIPGRSNAVAIAIRLGLDSQITETAKKLIGPKGLQDVNQVILGLEEQRERQQKAAEDAAALLARTELLYEELLARWEQQQETNRKWQEVGRYKLGTSIREGQREVRNLIRRLRAEGADGDIARKAGQRLKQIEFDSRPQVSRRNDFNWRPKIGDRVRLIALGKSGEIISISEDGCHLTVLCGIFRSTVDLSSIESLDGRKPSIPKSSVKVTTPRTMGSFSTVRTDRNTLDVRGLRVHEAEAVVEESLRNAIGKVWVIHGIGTGKLKRGLRQWLETLPYVERVVDAEQNDGGSGCSVIWLR